MPENCVVKYVGIVNVIFDYGKTQKRKLYTVVGSFPKFHVKHGSYLILAKNGKISINGVKYDRVSAYGNDIWAYSDTPNITNPKKNVSAGRRIAQRRPRPAHVFTLPIETPNLEVAQCESNSFSF